MCGVTGVRDVTRIYAPQHLTYIKIPQGSSGEVYSWHFLLVIYVLFCIVLKHTIRAKYVPLPSSAAACSAA
jgi:hypothetical protein